MVAQNSDDIVAMILSATRIVSRETLELVVVGLAIDGTIANTGERLADVVPERATRARVADALREFRDLLKS